ncbi:MAG TPA: hypothetical protein DCE61_08425 [Cellvibrionales bacterium]|jgi:hypothetical protein|nr:hypothetical protein [Pseudomonadales bacterium]HAB56363.1 hypothetical protein [Cellvibrionales bacterium]
MSSNSYAGTAVGVGGSTLGYQVALSQSLSENVNLKLSYNTASQSFDGETDGVNYDYDFEFESTSLLIDWHVFGGGFRLTTGALINDNEIFAQSDISGLTLEVGDTVFTSAEVGRLEGDISFDSYAPYLGLGWGRSITDGFSFVFDLGVVFQGEPTVNLQTVGGTLSDNSLLLDEVEREEQELQDDANDFDVYPVVSLGLFYSF